MKTKNQSNLVQNTNGFILNPKVHLSKDGNYLIHSVLGIRISKHVNYYKKILSSEANSEPAKKAI